MQRETWTIAIKLLIRFGPAQSGARHALGAGLNQSSGRPNGNNNTAVSPSRTYGLADRLIRSEVPSAHRNIYTATTPSEVDYGELAGTRKSMTMATGTDIRRTIR